MRPERACCVTSAHHLGSGNRSGGISRWVADSSVGVVRARDGEVAHPFLQVPTDLVDRDRSGLRPTAVPRRLGERRRGPVLATGRLTPLDNRCHSDPPSTRRYIGRTRTGVAAAPPAWHLHV